MRSWNCTHVGYAISRLECNLGILRMRNAISRLCKFSDCAEHIQKCYSWFETFYVLISYWKEATNNLEQGWSVLFHLLYLLFMQARPSSSGDSIRTNWCWFSLATHKTTLLVCFCESSAFMTFEAQAVCLASLLNKLIQLSMSFRLLVVDHLAPWASKPFEQLSNCF